MSPEDERHGTYAGWQAHLKDHEDPCAPCLDANAAYKRNYRRKNQNYKRQNSARAKALVRLSHLYPNDFQHLYADELLRARQRDQEAS